MEKLTALHPEGVLEPADLAEDFPIAGAVADLSVLPWKEARERYLGSFELSYARSVLARCDGNLSAAAREAGVDRKTFYALLRREKDPQPGE
jgi:transcriptional regulator of acetoin/glycerol metabolism